MGGEGCGLRREGHPSWSVERFTDRHWLMMVWTLDASKATSPKEEQSRSPYQQIVTMHPHLDERRNTDWRVWGRSRYDCIVMMSSRSTMLPPGSSGGRSISSSQPPVQSLALTCNKCKKPLTTTFFYCACHCMFCVGKSSLQILDRPNVDIIRAIVVLYVQILSLFACSSNRSECSLFPSLPHSVN